MEIDGTNPLIGVNNSVQRIDASQPSERPQKGGEEHSESDRLELSIIGREKAHLDELIRATPDVRDDKVEQVRLEIESGTYNIKAEKIAERIIGGNLLDEIF
jgi:negative regulator of flagellin synthesis FlgM